MLEVRDLSKGYGKRRVVDELSFTVRPGVVTGFLGPNGAGKSTTMKMVMGLVRPDGGRVTVGGVPYASLDDPVRRIGALLDAGWIQPTVSARTNLRWAAALGGVPAGRVEQVLDLVGLAHAGNRKVKGFSLGMRQRLGIAMALLGDAPVLMFDEPMNGLDPEGIRWIRRLLKTFAAEGRTVLVSSHLLSELAQAADEAVVIGAGRLIAHRPVRELVAEVPRGPVLVTAPEADRLARLVMDRGLLVTAVAPGTFTVGDTTPAWIGELACAHRIAVHELRQEVGSLEDAYFAMTASSTEYRGGAPENRSAS
ncbi:ABC transporter ATP-binding protein [Actinocorallia longicatena]|uniref:ABC transporter ATP-binding protein n=1 Tax=Actinocorallia longicatena TaxID=111803 RepID=A0ABP6QJU1_9ACTN